MSYENSSEQEKFTKFPQTILEAILSGKYEFTFVETRFLLLLVRQTYGFHKEIDTLSAGFCAWKISSSKHIIYRIRKRLTSRNVIKVYRSKGKTLSYSIVKKVDTWKEPKSNKKLPLFKNYVKRFNVN